MATHEPGPDCLTVGQLREQLHNSGAADDTPVVIWDETGSWEGGYTLYLPERTNGKAVFRIAGGCQLDTADDRYTT